jgi:hypothetical protein
VTTSERQRELQRTLAELDVLRQEWVAAVNDPKAGGAEDASRRERFKLLETKVAVLRLLQSENRLRQQLLLGLTSFLGGSAFTLLVKLAAAS